MCFFSAPSVSMPSTAESPAITETKAPEPESVVFGGGDNQDDLGSGTEGTRKKGIGALTIKKETEPVVDTTGANRGLN